ncbi:MAG: hypothetical protein H6674_02775 [Dehalococcoidia bacterium]|nr:hypothetical protein [Dehalococcoidia bacterium]
MTPRPFTIPTWAPAAAAAAFVIWAASIWWMVATLPTGGDTSAIEDTLDAVVAELESANGSIETLGGQVASLEEQRDALEARIAELETKTPVEGAFQMSPATSEDGDSTAAATTAEGDTSVLSTSAESSPFFTDGKDRYNCRDFKSTAEAQEALEVNGPSDPNRIDTNKNGLACEDFKYPTTGASTAASIATPAATTTAR